MLLQSIIRKTQIISTAGLKIEEQLQDLYPDTILLTQSGILRINRFHYESNEVQRALSAYLTRVGI